SFCFFFQAEDGIRDFHVTGVQTCALPILLTDPAAVRRNMGLTGQAATVDELLTGRENLRLVGSLYGLSPRYIRRASDDLLERFRSEERRVGKECRCRWMREACQNRLVARE